MDLGQEIATRRKFLGLSREALAARAEVSLSTLIRFELGTSIPHRSTLSVIRAALVEAEREATGAKS